jgi:hypothetical protein
MTIIEISLSRAHKVAERLKARATELFEQAYRLGQVSNVKGVSGQAQVDRLAEQARLSISLLVESERFMRATAAVRHIISRENQARGIDRLLAELEVVNRLVVQRRSMLAEAKGGSVPLLELLGFKSLGKESVYGSDGVEVRVLGPEQERLLEERLADLQRESFDLTDRIAELNGPRVKIELEDDIASHVVARAGSATVAG